MNFVLPYTECALAVTDVSRFPEPFLPWVHGQAAQPMKCDPTNSHKVPKLSPLITPWLLWAEDDGSSRCPYPDRWNL